MLPKQLEKIKSLLKKNKIILLHNLLSVNCIDDLCYIAF